MRGHPTDDSELRRFVTARTAELHRTAYLLTADQDRAERLVETIVGYLRRRGFDSGQAETTARHRMARMAAAVDIPGTSADDPALARLSSRQRAVLMLRCLEDYDRRSAARELGISRSRARTAEESASQSLGFAIGDDAVRQVLTDFADRATWPDPDTTMSRSAQVHAPRRHSRRHYLAVAAVLAVTAAAPIASQIRHDTWLRTPAGINASHGTHLHAYTQGYKLIGVDRVPIGGSQRVKAASGEVVAPICRHFSLTSQSSWAWLTMSGGSFGDGPFPCSKASAPRYYLLPLDGSHSISPPRSGAEDLVLGRYLRVPWDKYPVAKSHFVVQHDITVQSLTKLIGRTVASGHTVTLRGTNSVASAVIPLPPAAPGTSLYLTGVLSPTTTGEYKITLGGEPVTSCDAVAPDSPWCRVYDRHVPQIQIVQGALDGDSGGGAAASGAVRTVRVEARHVSGPWTVQLRFVRIPAPN